MSKTKEINEEFTMDMEAIQERTELPKQAVVYEEEQPKVKQKLNLQIQTNLLIV